MINDKLLNIQYRSGSLSFYKKDWLLPAAETTDMGFNFPLTAEHAERYTRIIEEGAAVRRHYDFLIWLRGGASTLPASRDHACGVGRFQIRSYSL